jgi:hypothetical protein
MAEPRPLTAILPDVLAFHVCPFLGNKDRASMLQLCHGVRRDLVARKVPSRVHYHIARDSAENDAEIVAQFNYMRRHGIRRLSLNYGDNSRLVRRVAMLDKLNYLIIKRSMSGIYDGIPLSISDFPPSIVILSIEAYTNKPLVINLDRLPNLAWLELRLNYSDVTFVATTTPQFLCNIDLDARSLVVARADAQRILAAPNFAHLDIKIKQYADSINETFDGLHAPELKTFASSGGGSNTYDLIAPKLNHINHEVYSCWPKSAPNITSLHVTGFNPNRYAQFTTLTYMSIRDYGTQICDLPPNLIVLNIDIFRLSTVMDIQYLPPRLQSLSLSSERPREVRITCAPPASLKEIKLYGGCTLYSLPRDLRANCTITIEAE